MREVWKNIDGYDGKYKVSNKGNVIKQDGILMAICDNGNGYKVVYLCKNSKRKIKLVHRLVAECFIANENNYPDINHKDEDKANNNYENLEWCTKKYNANYGTKINRTINHKNFIKARREKMGRYPKPTLKKKISQHNKNGELIRVWDGACDINRELGFDNSSITKCCKGKRKSANGFVWKYVE